MEIDKRKYDPSTAPPNFIERNKGGTSLVAQLLRLCTPNAGGPGSIPGPGTRSHTRAATNSSHPTTKEPVSHN